VRALSRVISFLFHPLLMATYLFTLLLFTVPFALDPIKEERAGSFIVLIFCVTFVLPALNIGLFRLFGTVKSFSMPTRSERIFPFVFIAILYCLITYLFYSRARMGLHDNMFRFLLIIDLLVISATLITFFYKISVHSLAMGGLTGILLPLNQAADSGVLFYPLLVVILLTGVVMTARLYLNAHSLREVLGGALVGFAVSFLSLGFLF
jgi:membrane-associated phospholipid phosphatase